MAKSKRQQDIDLANMNFDKMIAEFSATANKSRMLMPLFAQTLDLAVEIIKAYKGAYNATLNTNK